MDMSTSTSKSGASTATAPTAAASSSAMSGMSMGGMGPNACKISMLWNWYTIDACFISSTWQITSSGMFAGSCIGVICLVVSLEALRRAARGYDNYILRQAVLARNRALAASGSEDNDNNTATLSQENSKTPNTFTSRSFTEMGARTYTPTLVQQLVRALLHMLQFGVAYFIMLLAMYYNGYIIISILIGAFLGAFIFSWQRLSMQSAEEPQREITYCCG